MHPSQKISEKDQAVADPTLTTKLPPRQFETPKLVLPKKEAIQEEISHPNKRSIILNRFIAWMVGCAQLDEKDSQTVAPIWESLRKAAEWKNRGHDS